jgi:phosphonate transport system substrate-binding protein
MKEKYVVTLIFIFFLSLLLILPDRALEAEILRLGSISKDPQKEIEKFLPLARYIEKNLQPSGITDVKVVVAKSIPHMASLFNADKIDIFIDSPFPIVAVRCLSKTKLLLRRWKKGSRAYYTVIFVRKDSDIKELDELKGKKIAFDDPFSSSGYLLPKVSLMNEGFRVIPVKSISDNVKSNEIGYIFSYDDDNTLFWVSRGYVAAGAVDDQNFFHSAKKYKDSLRIIYRTLPIPRHIVSYRANLRPWLVARIKGILIQMEYMKEGRETLRKFEKTTRFDNLSPDDLAVLEKIQSFLDSQCELR